MTITEKILTKLQSLNGQYATGAQLRTKMGNRHSKKTVQTILSNLYIAREAGLTRKEVVSTKAGKTTRAYAYALTTVKRK